MRRLSVLVFASLACLAECALLPRSETAAPTSEQASGGTTFVLNQEPNLRFRARDASLDLLKAHLKYASALPPYLSKAVNLNPDLHRKYQALTQAGRSLCTPLKLPTLSRELTLARAGQTKAKLSLESSRHLRRLHLTRNT